MLIGNLVVLQIASRQADFTEQGLQCTGPGEDCAVARIVTPVERHLEVEELVPLCRLEVQDLLRRCCAHLELDVMQRQAEVEAIELTQWDTEAHPDDTVIGLVVGGIQFIEVRRLVDQIESAADPVDRVIGVGRGYLVVAVCAAGLECQRYLLAGTREVVLVDGRIENHAVRLRVTQARQQ